MFHLAPSYILLLVVLLTGCMTKSGPTSSDEECPTGSAYSVQLSRCVSTTNAAPLVGADQSELLSEEGSVSFTVPVGTDAEEDTLTYAVYTNPAHGVITNCMNKSGSSGTTDRTCTYTPEANYSGTDSFTYRVHDGTSYSSTFATVSFTIAGIDDGPTPTTSLATLTEDVVGNVTLYYNDFESDLATACSVTGEVGLTESTVCSCSAGTCTVGLVNSTAHDNSGSESGTFSFNYNITAGGVTSGNVPVTVTVNDVNDNPVISVPAACNSPIDEDMALSCPTQPTVTNYDTGDTHTWELTGSTTCTWVTINSSTGVISGTPNDTHIANSPCTIAYNVKDQTNAYATPESVSITLNNVAPVISAFPSPAGVVEDSGSTTIYVDADIESTDEGFGGSYSLGTPTIGTPCSLSDLSLDNSTTGAISYNPPSDYAPTFCSFRVIFTDSNSATDAEDIAVVFTPTNDLPTFVSTPASSIDINYGLSADNITFSVDEGGGTDEDAQIVSLTITSSNTTLLPLSGITVTHAGTTAYTAATPSSTPFSIGASSTDASSNNITVSLAPAGGQAGSSTITYTLVDDDGGTATATTTFTVEDIFALHNGWTKAYAIGRKVDTGAVVSSKASVTIDWAAMSVLTGGVSTNTHEWNVYRSQTSGSYDYTKPVNSSPISNGTLSFSEDEDSTLGPSNTPIAPGETYYYEVRPLDSAGDYVYFGNGSAFKEIRVVVPPDNMALVHRWMVNKEVCESMGKTPSATTNFNCDYTGPGNTGSKYDFGSYDLFVDQIEAGCNYSTDAGCPSGSCIAMGDPVTLTITPVADPAVYYDRSSGTCYYSNSGPWTAFDGSFPFTSFNPNFYHIPPLVNITHANAKSYCEAIDPYCAGVACDSTPFPAANKKRLITRMEQVAASAWNPVIAISSMETGGDLTASSVCNTSSTSNGLTYMDLDVPVPSLIDTLPFTNTASKLSVRTGSDATTSCVSTYGMQDMVGNVREWGEDTFVCDGIDCTSATLGGYDLNGDGNPDGPEYATVNSGSAFPYTSVAYIFYPLGMPVSATGNDAVDTTAMSLYDDELSVENITTTNYFTFGGSWSSSNGATDAKAGRWTADFLDGTPASDVGFRCVIPVNY